MAASTLKTDRKEFMSTERKIRPYDSLLYKIAAEFGFDSSDRQELVEEVHSFASRHPEGQEELLPKKIWLAKLIVHKCVFKISSQMFQQPETCTKQMPLSFRTAYLLNNLVGFNEEEIAVILNTTPINIKQRLHRAILFVHRNR
jgi:hypothetical protein